MTSDRAYVWFWRAGETTPVLVGRLRRDGDRFTFRYARTYLATAGAVPLAPDLQLGSDERASDGLSPLHGVFRDASPDAWGRRVIARHTGRDPDELELLVLASSDRPGALDFTTSSSAWMSRSAGVAPLATLLEAADLVDRGLPLPPALDLALLHGSSVGGARPKALLHEGDAGFIAKFGSSTDLYPVAKAEFLAMRLASRAGIQVAQVELRRVLGRDVLLVRRFDRAAGARRHFLSALSLLGLDELEARYASYADLADRVRRDFAAPRAALRELFRRLVFNVLVGNTDDHARNHAAFWDGEALALTPAYDLCPQLRSGREATQAMAIGGARGNLSTLANVVSVCGTFLLGDVEARALVQELVDVVRGEWERTCDEAALPEVERRRLLGAAVLNPFCFEGWDAG